MKVSSLFKKAPAPVKTATKKAGAAAKKAVGTVKKATGTTGGRGWLGSGSGSADLSKWYGPSRVLYLPDGLLARDEVPAYLNGELAGDYGYDPLGLGENTEQVNKYRAYELLHARWAMLGAAGAIIPEGLAANGADLKGATWYETPAALATEGLNYFAVPWAIIPNPLPLVVVAAINIGLIGAVERFRGAQEGPPGYAPGVGNFDSNIYDNLDTLYPGGPFDPLGLADDPEVFAELKVKEIKNGRLAMVSILGFWIQSLVTKEGPYANWAGHVADPFGYNLLTILGAPERQPTL